ncbi:hypothetical protein FOL47_004392 [Perkinsus chesapeaki]|uniref:TIR domain-containing protein n=1 Tax=Perkinsus chesapeaki TaxID=330153 RepID=A0A7J6MZ74_PERCH|nr:hypothetical protein FOL47_004392 [Perkinsus chesapeaki]
MSAANVGEHMESGYIRLRGCHLSSIIWRGNLLHDSKSCPNAYENSFDVSRLDFFLSHAWAANGTWKRLGIVMTFYLSFPFKLLIASSHVLVGFIYLAMHSAKLPTIAAILAGFFTFLVALLISLLTQNRGVTVFLDKCCITQSDPIAKLQGISRLSDYLRVSDKLVVFWSPDYLKRLWCVYELAKFLETHKMKDVIIINLDHVKFCVYMMFGELGRIVILECLVLYNHQIDIATRMPTILVWYFVSLFVAGRSAYYMDTTLSFRQMVRTFKTSNAKCSDAADEPLLHDLIKDAYGSIESFEVVVRNLCLGDDELGHNPTWLFSKATLRMLSVPFIPYIIEGALLSAFYGLDGTSMPMCVIGSPAPSFAKHTRMELKVNNSATGPEPSKFIAAVYERGHGVLLSQLRHRLLQEQGQPRLLVDIIAEAVYAINCSPRHDLGTLSAFQLFYCCRPRLLAPAEDLEDWSRSKLEVWIPSIMEGQPPPMPTTLKNIYDELRERRTRSLLDFFTLLEEAKDRIRARASKLPHQPGFKTFDVGSLVLRLVPPPLKQDVSWKGPYRVVAVTKDKMLYRLQEIETGTELKFQECYFNLKQYHASDMVTVESSTSKSTTSEDGTTLDLKDGDFYCFRWIDSQGHEHRAFGHYDAELRRMSLRRVHFDGSTEILNDHVDSQYMCDVDAHYEAPLRMTRSIKNFIINFVGDNPDLYDCDD